MKRLDSYPVQDLVSQWNMIPSTQNSTDLIDWFSGVAIVEFLGTKGDPPMSAVCAFVTFRISLKKQLSKFDHWMYYSTRKSKLEKCKKIKDEILEREKFLFCGIFWK